jgi:outer membrane protein OmpA-like peptidoglycan-associated protein
MTARIWTLLVFLAFGGCASSTAPEAQAPSAPPASEPTRAAQRTAAASTLAIERQWLAAWFKGTPVVIAQRPDGAVVVEVPREFCFEAGQEIVKPALAAVLDKVARSMRRTAIAELHLIAAPGDQGGAAALGMRRATRVYDFLRARGLPAGRLARPSATSGTAVQLRIEASSPA